MINLDVDSYCQNCPEFKPKVIKENLFSKDAEEFEGVETFITCKHEKRCRSMVDYLTDRYEKSHQIKKDPLDRPYIITPCDNE